MGGRIRQGRRRHSITLDVDHGSKYNRLYCVFQYIAYVCEPAGSLVVLPDSKDKLYRMALCYDPIAIELDVFYVKQEANEGTQNT